MSKFCDRHHEWDAKGSSDRPKENGMKCGEYMECPGCRRCRNEDDDLDDDEVLHEGHLRMCGLFKSCHSHAGTFYTCLPGNILLSY